MAPSSVTLPIVTPRKNQPERRLDQSQDSLRKAMALSDIRGIQESVEVKFPTKVKIESYKKAWGCKHKYYYSGRLNNHCGEKLQWLQSISL